MGIEFFLAPVLVHFRDSINKAYPHRDISSDGWIGDTSHAARKSEHNPCWLCRGYLYGIVRAIDVDIDDNDTTGDLRREIISSAVGHPAVWYVISNGIIWSRTFGWKPRAYNGANKHLKHVHISAWTSIAASKDQTLVLKRPPAPKPPKDDDMTPEETTAAFLSALQTYGKALFKDESGTADTIWDEVRDARAAQAAKMDELIASVNNLAAAIAAK